MRQRVRERCSATSRNGGNVPKNIAQLFEDRIVVAQEAVGVATLFFQRAHKTADFADETKQSGVHVAGKLIRGRGKPFEF